MSKSKRLLEIKKIIQGNKIASQQELLDILNREGFKYTQATLSRDLKYLKAGKMQDSEKGMIYILPDNISVDYVLKNPNQTPSNENGYISIEYTGNMAVIKTLPGFASSLAYKIDQMDAFEIIGTIAGDDTILVIGREGIPRNDITESLKPVIPSIGLPNKSNVK